MIDVLNSRQPRSAVLAKILKAQEATGFKGEGFRV